MALAFGVGPADFADDFESGQVFTSDGGAWDSYEQPPRQGVAIAASAAAAHRGAFGLRVTDTDPSDGGGAGTAVQRTFSAGVTGTLYLRFWMRVTPDASAGDGTFFFAGFQGVSSGIGGSDSASTFSIINDGFDSANNYFRYPAGTMSTSTWHLIELTLDSSAATSTDQLRIDGVTVLWSPPIDRSGFSATGVRVGEGYADRHDFVGTLDFDDYRSSATPMASALSLAIANPRPTAGDCVPLTVDLLDFDGGAAPAPYVFLAAMSADAGTFHGDLTCSSVTVMTTATFVAGAAQSRPIWFRPLTAGTVELFAAYADFLPAALTVTVDALDAGPRPDAGADAGAVDAGAPDAGAPDGGSIDAGPTDAGVTDAGEADAGTGPPQTSGCQCGEAQAPPLLLLAALAALVRRRRRA
jgi:MYXO-CTERM domain-containing protein